jgi:hypothetical protein
VWRHSTPVVYLLIGVDKLSWDIAANYPVSSHSVKVMFLCHLDTCLLAPDAFHLVSSLINWSVFCFISVVSLSFQL